MRVSQQLKNTVSWSLLKGCQRTGEENWGYQPAPRANCWVPGSWTGTGHRISSAPPLLLLATGQALETLVLSGALTLVLEEDGTTVESEDFFQLLEDDTCLMVLELGQSWSPRRVRPILGLQTTDPFCLSQASCLA